MLEPPPGPVRADGEPPDVTAWPTTDAGSSGAGHISGRPPPSLARLGGFVLRSAVLPGSGHLATGRRRVGWLVVVVALVVLAALAAGLAVVLVSPGTAASWTVRPVLLTALRWGTLLVAACWIGVIVHSAVLVRPGSRGVAGRLVAGGTAAVLAAAVALPAAEVTHYADVQRDFVGSVFHHSPGLQAAGGAVTAPDTPIRNGRLNVLLIGSDAGPDRTGVRTDTVVLASLDTRNGRTVLFTLPRNLERVPFTPGSVMAREFPRGFSCGSECLLNAIYRWAVDHGNLFPGDPQPGITALRSAVTETLGLPVDYYALVDLGGFQKLVDALGGVTIRVERRLPIGGLDAVGNHVRPSGYIEPGLQHMSGETALAYARSRSDSSDYERVLRQRCLLGAIQRQADPRNVLVNFQRVAASTADALQTDIPQELLPALVKLAFKVKAQPIQSLPFTPPLIDVTRPDVARMRALVQAALVPAPATPPAQATTPPPATSMPVPGTAPTTPPDTPVSLDAVCSYS